MDDDFEALLRQHVKARKVGTFPKQPPFYGPLRAIVKAVPPSAVVDTPDAERDDYGRAGAGFARKRPAPEGHGSSLLERVAQLEREISDLRGTVHSQTARIEALEALTGTREPPVDSATVETVPAQ